MSRLSLVIFWLVTSLALYSPVARAQQGSETPAPVFEFHSGFWINLHHFLYLQGRIRNAGAEPRAPELQAQSEYSTLASTSGMTPDQQEAWSAAVNAYAKNWSSLDLNDSDMLLINNRLAELENCSDLSGRGDSECISGLQPEMAAALTEAAPLYRMRWWPEQDRENRAWIDAVAPLVRRMGVNMANQLVEVYQRKWPEGRFRVDVAWYAGPQGAYTSLNPVHVTMASHDVRNQGLAAFEMLFNEASNALASGVNQAIVRECRQRDEPIPRDLWNALLFYTTGELVLRALANTPAPNGAAAPVAGYIPYAKRNGLYDRGWSNYYRVLERFWKPYLDGQVVFDTAVARMVSGL